MMAEFGSSRSSWVGVTGVALALAAGIVLGNGSDTGEAAATAARSAAQAAPAPAPGQAAAPRETVSRLSLERLKRGGPLDAPVTDVFAGGPWAAPAPPPPPPAPPPPRPAAPPEPVAPPLPFVYLGTFAEEGQEPVYYLEHGAQVLALPSGATIADTYRLVGLAGGELEFIYLPLHTRQALRIRE